MILAPGKQISAKPLSYLPRESTEGSGHIRCRCRPEGRGALAQAIASHKLPSLAPTLAPGAMQDSQAELVNKHGAGDGHQVADRDVSSDPSKSDNYLSSMRVLLKCTRCRRSV